MASGDCPQRILDQRADHECHLHLVPEYLTSKYGQSVSQGRHSGRQSRLGVLGKSVLLDNLFSNLGDKVLSSKNSLSSRQTLEDPRTCLPGFTDLNVSREVEDPATTHHYS